MVGMVGKVFMVLGLCLLIASPLCAQVTVKDILVEMDSTAASMSPATGTGKWTKANSSAAIGGSYYSVACAGNTGTSTATFDSTSFSSVTAVAGQYSVWVHFPSKAKATTAAVFTITGGSDGTAPKTTCTIDQTQTQLAGEWVYCATTTFSTNDHMVVTLKNNCPATPKQYAVADAVRIVKVGGGFSSLVVAGDGLASDIDSTGLLTLSVSGITSGMIGSNTISAAKIQSNAVTTVKILDANVTTAKLADSSVTTAKLADGSVTAAKMASGAVTTTLIADSNVTTAKIADSSITLDKIAPGVLKNPLRVAQLRWYGVNSGALAITVGTNPFALAFDGTNMWVANRGSNNVMRFTSAGAQVGGAITVGTNPFALAFDGTNMWVANSGDNTVQRISTAGVAVGSAIAVGTSPEALAFDGTNMWVANSGSDNTVQRISTAGVAVGSAIPAGTTPVALAFDGTNMWVANSGSGDVMRFDTAGAQVGGAISLGTIPSALAFDGANMWLANSSGELMRFDAGGVQVGETVSTAYNFSDVCFDGTHIWVAAFDGSNVSRYDLIGNQVGDSVLVTTPSALAFDGANVWAASFSGNSVVKK